MRARSVVQVVLGGGRPLPSLLVVTSVAAMVRKLGAGVRSLLSDLAAQTNLYDAVPVNASSAVAQQLVRSRLRQDNSIKGVVILGGYDIVPSLRVDTLPPSVAARVERDLDPDLFYVWSDDRYGDVDGDGLPELPVSRIPDSGSLGFLVQSLSAPLWTGPRRQAGIRNAHRAYADDIFRLLGQDGTLLKCERTTSRVQPPYSLAASAVYVVLHGEPDDGTRAWGEDANGGFPVAVELRNVPRACSGSVVLDASCWAGLTVEQRACEPVTAIVGRTVQSSRALAFLDGGARAVVGCTGSHYSPTLAPYRYNGEPLHRAFWQRFAAGEPPVQALYRAKYLDYVRGIPHRSDGGVTEACELKLLHGFTCLGLGW